MEKKRFLQPQHASFAKAASPKSKKHYLQLIIAQVTSPRKINPRKNLLLTRLQAAFPTGISLGANVLRQVSNILRYVCCISFMITQMTPPARHFMFFWDLESSLSGKFSRRMFSRHAKQHMPPFPAIASSQRHAVHISSCLTRKSGTRALAPAPLFHYFLMPAQSC